MSKEKQISWKTPDDFDIEFTLASLSQRAIALFLDILLLTLITIALFEVMRFATRSFAPTIRRWIAALFLLAHMVLWNVYWIWCEWKRNGQTFGKQRVGIQVLHAGRGTVSLPGILTRNLLREAEFWIPLRVLISLAVGSSSGMMFLWGLSLLLVPIIDRKNRRLGDLLSGTAVVRTPSSIPLPEDILQFDDRVFSSKFFFSTDMLNTYGTVQLYALQDVLERTVLRRQSTGTHTDHRQLLTQIKDKIVEKINYPDPVPDEQTEAFLQTFYRDMRKHLEKQLLSGRKTRKELKEDLDQPTHQKMRRQLKERFRESTH